MTKLNPFRYFKTSPEIILLAVMFYIHFPLSLRNVEDLLFERGIDVSHETIRFWWNRFGPMFASEIRRKRTSPIRAYSNWQWHLDEVFVKINGEVHYLWRSVDHECEVLESYVTKRLDRKAALKFLRKSMKRYGQPQIIVTDKLRSYGAAMKIIGKKRAVGRKTGLRIHTCHSDDENGRCFASGKCDVYRNSLQYTRPSTTTSNKSVVYHRETSSSSIVPPLSTNGAVLARHKGQ